MAATPEAKVKAAVRKILDTHDVYYFSPQQGGMVRVECLTLFVVLRGTS